ncbi:MAG TPA: alcohol dehydrogenase catalytic domain-containing protein [Solirubrobacteraceae bacterium]|jgi:alcohol dehydrogenase
MRQLAFIEAGRVAWQQVPDPQLTDPRGALVRPLAVARCDLDQPMAAVGFFPGPFAVGHETVAEVIAVGDEVSERRVGERVLVPFQVSCGTCVACRDCRFGACHTYRARAGGAFGFGEAGGGHGGAVADILAVPAADHMLLSAPEGSASALCALPDNACDAFRAVGPQLAEHPGAEVLIVSGAAASIGLYAVAFGRALGAARVHYVDRDEQRCAAAAALGAEVEHQQGPWPRRYDRAPITVEATGELEGLNAVLRSTDDYGFCTAVAIHFAPTVALPLLEMYTRGITLHVSRADSRRLLPAVLELFADRRFDPLAVPTTVVPWDRADEAWLAPATKLVLERT